MIKLIYGDCLKELNNIEQKIDLFLSDIPYGISLNDWDVLHNNNNSALLGSSPAQKQKSGFKRRGKPLNGWSKADKNIGKEYQEWCNKWVQKLYPMMQDGSSLFIFTSRRLIHRVINAFEDNNFLLKDILAWENQLLNLKHKESVLY